MTEEISEEPIRVPCRGALNIAGEHFPCDWPTDENGRHDGWAHANKVAQAIWSSDDTRPVRPPEPADLP
jgi:hypothetical protein